MSFMEFANEKFTANTPQKTGKIIVSIKDDKLATLYKLIKELDWETNEDKLRSGKFAAILELLISLMVLVGLVIVVVSFSATILYVILAINKSRYEIDTLMLIGVPRTFIVRWYMVNLGAINALIGLSTWLSLTYLKSLMDGFAAGYSYELYDGLHLSTYLTIAATLLVLWIVQYFRIRKLDK
jgi:ABC-type lipoprotein release transport system permease subunit